ncbi:MAG: sigma-70 family RNA polymerase sigma factor [Phycisphaera sp.]|nr:MAG: sigma-70 family RNA polymerase sigma factor [Phycisphaera sp.]
MPARDPIAEKTAARDPLSRVSLGTQTTTQLLDDLRDRANAPAWEAFDARYRPILTAFAHRLGFAGDDAAELAQQTLAEFSRAYAQGRYQRGQGRLSSWLIGIASNVGSQLRRKSARHGGAAEFDSQIDGDGVACDDERELRAAWDRERDRAAIAEALTVLRDNSRVKPQTMRAFELFAIRGVPAEEVAIQCRISVDAVYVIKNRLTGRLREIVAELTIAYDEGD